MTQTTVNCENCKSYRLNDYASSGSYSGYTQYCVNEKKLKIFEYVNAVTGETVRAPKHAHLDRIKLTPYCENFETYIEDIDNKNPRTFRTGDGHLNGTTEMRYD